MEHLRVDLVRRVDGGGERGSDARRRLIFASVHRGSGEGGGDAGGRRVLLASAPASRVEVEVEWSGVEWSGAEWSGVEWSGVEWSGVEWLYRPKIGQHLTPNN